MSYVNCQQVRFDDSTEARYQTIGRGHGFTELDGVLFKISEKYSYLQSHPDLTNQLNDLRVSRDRPTDEAYSYSFELEKKVLENMAAASS